VSGVEIATLTWLADLLKGLAGSAVADRLKRRSSPEQARVLAYEVHRRLGEVESESVGFLVTLSVYARADDDALEASLGQGRGMLRYSASEVAGALQRLSRALEAIDPQLAIHAPELHELIHDSIMTRGGVVRSVLEMRFEDMTLSEAKQAFRETYDEASSALQKICEATWGMREFISREFSFKDGF
jgi:hypothetical protein